MRSSRSPSPRTSTTRLPTASCPGCRPVGRPARSPRRASFRLLLDPAVTGTQRAGSEVTAVLAGMRRDPRWRLLPDISTLAEPTIDVSVLMGQQQVTDLQLVNLAATHGVRLATFDATIPTWLAPADRVHVEVIAA